MSYSHAVSSSTHRVGFNQLTVIAAAFSALTLMGCLPSLVYSPSAQLPAAPLLRDHAQASFGGELLPETRPRVASANAVKGITGFIRYGISDRVTLQVKSWYDLENPADERSGIAVSAIVPFGDSTADVRFGAMLTTAFITGSVFGDWAISGTGFGLSALAWIPITPHLLTLYMGLGPVYGVRNPRYSGYGYGAILNAGLAARPFSSLTANLEATGVFAHDVYDKRNDLILSPSLSVGWEF